jgi:hypothetical protein
VLALLDSKCSPANPRLDEGKITVFIAHVDYFVRLAFLIDFWRKSDLKAGKIDHPPLKFLCGFVPSTQNHLNASDSIIAMSPLANLHSLRNYTIKIQQNSQILPVMHFAVSHSDNSTDYYAVRYGDSVYDARSFFVIGERILERATELLCTMLLLESLPLIQVPLLIDNKTCPDNGYSFLTDAKNAQVLDAANYDKWFKNNAHNFIDDNGRNTHTFKPGLLESVRNQNKQFLELFLTYQMIMTLSSRASEVLPLSYVNHAGVMRNLFADGTWDLALVYFYSKSDCNVVKGNKHVVIRPVPGRMSQLLIYYLLLCRQFEIHLMTASGQEGGSGVDQNPALTNHRDNPDGDGECASDC